MQTSRSQTKKHVHFAKNVWVKEIDHIEDFAPSEIEAMWFSRIEISLIQYGAVQRARQLYGEGNQTEGFRSPDGDQCVRGLGEWQRRKRWTFEK